MFEYQKIRIALTGSDKYGNDVNKQKAVATLQDAGFDTINITDVWENYGCDRVTQTIIKSDILYIFNPDGHIGRATTSKLATAKHNNTLIYTYVQPSNEVHEFYCDGVYKLNELIEYLNK